MEALEYKKSILVYEQIEEIRYGPFSCMHFVWTSKEKRNFVASQLKQHLRGGSGGDFPGYRTSGNLLVYFRIKESSNLDKRPEVFFVCQGHAYKSIIHLTDSVLRTKAAKHFIDGRNIKEISFLNIAGPNVSNNITFKHTTDIFTHRTTYMNAYISYMSGYIHKNCKLDTIVQGNEGKDIQMTVGKYFVRIQKHLSYEQIGKILKLFSTIIYDDACDFPADAIDALDYIQRVTDRHTSSELEESLTNKAIDMLTGKGNLFDFYLGHRYSQDWSRSSDIKLYGKNDFELGCWSSSPSLVEVVNALDKWYPTSENPTSENPTSKELERYLKQNKIQLVYSRPGRPERMPLQKYIHGCVKQPEGTYFKVEQTWYVFSSSLYQVLDRNFSFLSNLLLKQEAITNIIKYPWHSKTTEIVESNSTIKTVLGVDKTFPDDKLKEIFEILTDKFDLLDDTGNALFTKHSCLFPMASKLCTKSGKVSYNDSTPGPSNSLDQSILTQSSDGTISLVSKGRTNEKKRNKIRLKLLDIFEKKSTDTKGLLTKIAMLSKNETHYLVENAVVTTELLSKINDIEPSLKDTDIFNFLKSFSNLNENEYNELYLFASAPDGYFVLPGDRIEPNKVELFDLLVHDSEKRVSYLFQVKKGLDYHTRDACAQIRNSAELLWHDFMRGHKRHIELFWENVVESKTATSVYRHFVREKLMTLKKEEFVRMFDNDVQLVFVLAFSTKSAKNNQFLKWNFQLITSEMLYKLDSKFDSTVHSALKKKDILTELGYLADSFIGMTQDRFIHECSDDPRLIKLSIEKKKELYRILRDHGTCDLSTIAKLELLTLDNCFNKFQIGGSGRRFKLQICHIDSC